MKKIGIILILCITLICCESKEDRILREKSERFQKDCEELITKYNPIEFADGSLDYWGMVFTTVELEKMINLNSERLVYYPTIINDVIDQDSTYLVRFGTPSRFEPQIFFTLDCNKELGDKLLTANLGTWNDVRIIASIESVKKISFGFNIFAEDEWGYHVVDSSNHFVAKGKLIDFAYKEY